MKTRTAVKAGITIVVVRSTNQNANVSNNTNANVSLNVIRFLTGG